MATNDAYLVAIQSLLQQTGGDLASREASAQQAQVGWQQAVTAPLPQLNIPTYTPPQSVLDAIAQQYATNKKALATQPKEEASTPSAPVRKRGLLDRLFGTPGGDNPIPEEYRTASVPKNAQGVYAVPAKGTPEGNAWRRGAEEFVAQGIVRDIARDKGMFEGPADVVQRVAELPGGSAAVNRRNNRAVEIAQQWAHEQGGYDPRPRGGNAGPGPAFVRGSHTGTAQPASGYGFGDWARDTFEPGNLWMGVKGAGEGVARAGTLGFWQPNWGGDPRSRGLGQFGGDVATYALPGLAAAKLFTNPAARGVTAALLTNAMMQTERRNAQGGPLGERLRDIGAKIAVTSPFAALLGWGGAAAQPWVDASPAWRGPLLGAGEMTGYNALSAATTPGTLQEKVAEFTRNEPSSALIGGLLGIRRPAAKTISPRTEYERMAAEQGRPAQEPQSSAPPEQPRRATYDDAYRDFYDYYAEGAGKKQRGTESTAQWRKRVTSWVQERYGVTEEQAQKLVVDVAVRGKADPQGWGEQPAATPPQAIEQRPPSRKVEPPTEPQLPTTRTLEEAIAAMDQGEGIPFIPRDESQSLWYTRGRLNAGERYQAEPSLVTQEALDALVTNIQEAVDAGDTDAQAFYHGMLEYYREILHGHEAPYAKGRDGADAFQNEHGSWVEQASVDTMRSMEQEAVAAGDMSGAAYYRGMGDRLAELIAEMPSSPSPPPTAIVDIPAPAPAPTPAMDQATQDQITQLQHDITRWRSDIKTAQMDIEDGVRVPANKRIIGAREQQIATAEAEMARMKAGDPQVQAQGEQPTIAPRTSPHPTLRERRASGQGASLPMAGGGRRGTEPTISPRRGPLGTAKVEQHPALGGKAPKKVTLYRGGTSTPDASSAAPNSTRFGTGTYYSSSETVADIFRRHRGENATVSRQEIDLSQRKILDLDTPDYDAPEFVVLAEQLGMTPAQLRAADERSGLERVIKAKEYAQGGAFPGGDRFREVVTSAGYDGVKVSNSGGTDFPADTEYVLFDAPPRTAVFDEQAVAIANATARSAGSVGSKALVPRYVRETSAPNETILDFGAGPVARHTKNLREEGFTNVTAHEFGSNVVDGVHDPRALNKQYDTVFASNVLNVQSSPQMMDATLDQITSSVKPGGRAVVNYPESPRKSGMTPKDVQAALESRFAEVRRVGGTVRAPVFEAKGPGQQPAADTNMGRVRPGVSRGAVRIPPEVEEYIQEVAKSLSGAGEHLRQVYQYTLETITKIAPMEVRAEMRRYGTSIPYIRRRLSNFMERMYGEQKGLLRNPGNQRALEAALFRARMETLANNAGANISPELQANLDAARALCPDAAYGAVRTDPHFRKALDAIMQEVQWMLDVRRAVHPVTEQAMLDPQMPFTHLAPMYHIEQVLAAVVNGDLVSIGNPDPLISELEQGRAGDILDAFDVPAALRGSFDDVLRALRSIAKGKAPTRRQRQAAARLIPLLQTHSIGTAQRASGEAPAYNLSLRRVVGRDYEKDYASAMLAEVVKKGLATGEVVKVGPGERVPQGMEEIEPIEKRAPVLAGMGIGQRDRLFASPNFRRVYEDLGLRLSTTPEDEDAGMKLANFITSAQLSLSFGEVTGHVARIFDIMSNVDITSTDAERILWHTPFMGHLQRFVVQMMKLHELKGTPEWDAAVEAMQRAGAYRHPLEDYLKTPLARRLEKIGKALGYTQVRDLVFDTYEPGMRVVAYIMLKRAGYSEADIFDVLDGIGVGEANLLGALPYMLHRKWKMPFVKFHAGVETAAFWRGILGSQGTAKTKWTTRISNIMAKWGGPLLFAAIITKLLTGRSQKDLGLRAGEIPVGDHLALNTMALVPKSYQALRLTGMYYGMPDLSTPEGQHQWLMDMASGHANWWLRYVGTSSGWPSLVSAVTGVEGYVNRDMSVMKDREHSLGSIPGKVIGTTLPSVDFMIGWTMPGVFGHPDDRWQGAKEFYGMPYDQKNPAEPPFPVPQGGINLFRVPSSSGSGSGGTYGGFGSFGSGSGYGGFGAK